MSRIMWGRGGAVALTGLVLAFGPARAQEPVASGAITGTVTGRFQERAQPLPFAAVEAWTVGTRRSVVADSLGRYRVGGLPAGLVRLRVTHPGHDPSILDVIVPGGSAALVDVELRGHPVELPSLEVTTAPDVADPTARDAEPRGMADVEVTALGSGAGLAETGVAEAVRAMPGNDPAQPTDVLFMRGSTTDLKLVLLDGAPVFTPFHVAGLIRSFEPAALGRADLHMGGAPARYDGGLTYILDLRTRTPRGDRIRGSGSADLLSAGMTLDGPLGGSSGFVASTRTLHHLADDPLGSSPYGYRDGLLSVERELAPDQTLRGTGFWNRESVLLEVPGGLAGDGMEAWWSNRALSASWRGRVGSLLTEVTLAGGAYDASLPLQPSAPEGEPVPDPLLATAANRRVRAGAEVARAGEGGVFRMGVSGETVATEYEAGALGSSAPSSRTAADARSVGAYLDVTRRVSPELTVRAGLRADGLSGVGGGLLLAPRAALTWSLAPRAFLTVAAGRYHQHARAPRVEVEASISAAVDPELTAAELLPVATADHVVLSLDQELGAETRLGLEGFWKGYQGLGGSGDEEIRASGVDLRVRRLGEEFTAWLGYGLSWYWSTTDLSGSYDTFSGRHLLSAGMEGSLAGRLGGRVQVAYGAGLPYTSIPFGPGSDQLDSEAEGPTPGEMVDAEGPLAGGVDEAFLRLDLEVNALLTPRWGGREWTVRPYLRLLNALDRRDALFYAFSRSGGVAPLAERSVIPVLGVSWRF